MNKIPGQVLYGLCLLLVLMAAFSLRSQGISRYDFWYDEIITTKYSQPNLERSAFYRGVSPGERFLSLLRQDFQAPLYYALVRLYSHLFKDEMALRWLSVVMGILALVVFYLLSRNFLRKWEALIALALMAVSPFQIWYSQEARPYTSISLFSLLAVYCFMIAVRTEKIRWWATFLCFGIAAVLVSYYSIALLAPAGLVLLKRKNRHLLLRGTVCLASIGAVIIVVLMPLLIPLANFILHGTNWLNPPTLRELFFSPLVFLAGYLALPSQMVLGLILCWLLLVRGVFVFFREEKGKFAFIFSCSFIPLLLIFLVSRLGMPIYLDRQLIVFAPFFYLFMARGLSSIKEKALKLGAISLFGVFLTLALVNYYQGTVYPGYYKGREFYPGVHQRKVYGPLMKRVLYGLLPGEKIITADIQSTVIVSRLLQASFRTNERDVFVFNLGTLDLYVKRNYEISKLNIGESACGLGDVCGYFPLPGRYRVVRKVNEADFDQQRVWLVSSSWDNTRILPKEADFIRGFLQKKFKETVSMNQDGFFVQLYEKRDKVP